MSDLLTYASAEDWARGAADAIAADLRASLAAKGRATLAVAGGTTPGPIFDDLAQADLDWTRVTILPSDERWVPERDPASNAGLIRARLGVGRAARAGFVSLYHPGDTPEAGMDALTRAVAAVLPVDVALLGMGNDGHTASLFPDTDGLAAALAPGAAPVHVLHRPEGPPARITLSGPVLAAIPHVHLALRGDEKAATFRRVSATGPIAAAPVRLVLPRAKVHWVG